MKRKNYVVVAWLLMALIMASGVSVAFAQTPANQRQSAEVGEIPFINKWMGSGHADFMGLPFNDWNDTNPPAVPVDCAKCHSTPGFIDYMGADGSAFRVTDKPAPIGTTIQCIACHNDPARLLTSVKFPSGIEVGALESSNRCAECHQGRASKVQVDASIRQANLADVDTVSPALRFINIHYYAAAATLYGSEVKGGYEYEGMAYQPRFRHVEGYTECKNCHDPHSLDLKVSECAGCHQGVATTEDLRKIRMPGSLADYDGDGNITEPIRDEIAGLQQQLMTAMQSYARQVSKPIAYDPASYPYFFNDANNNGTVDANEAGAANSYNGFSPRLLKAAYNLQTSIKDPGGYAHNAKYLIQLLHDSINDLDLRLGVEGLAEGQRDDPGHFAATHLAFRDWDAEGEVPATCTRCHTSGGLPFFLQNGVTIAMEPSESLKCTTCHANMQNWALLQDPQVTFPSGASVSFENINNNLCINCHQGRESKVSVDRAIQQSGAGANQVSAQLSFRNPHYFAAGATLFGTEVKGAYEFDGRQYAGRFMHVPSYDSCVECHDPHRLNVRAEQCGSCHQGVQSLTDVYNIRFGSVADYDGDGNTSEGIALEIDTMREKLLSALQGYASNTIGTPVAYSSLNYPYWYVDTNGNGQADADEVNSQNTYRQWTPSFLRAAYNFQWVTKDPGAFAHNGRYIMQLLYDSIQTIGGNQAVAGMTRP